MSKAIEWGIRLERGEGGGGNKYVGYAKISTKGDFPTICYNNSENSG